MFDTAPDATQGFLQSVGRQIAPHVVHLLSLSLLNTSYHGPDPRDPS